MGTRVWLAAGTTDMRKGFTGLCAVVQNALASNPFCGQVFVFRGRRGDLLKLLWWDGTGLCLMAKRLERGRFIWLNRRYFKLFACERYRPSAFWRLRSCSVRRRRE